MILYPRQVDGAASFCCFGTGSDQPTKHDARNVPYVGKANNDSIVSLLDRIGNALEKVFATLML